MIADIITVLNKELREALLPQAAGARRWASGGGWLNLAVLLVVFGLFLPYQNGRAWVESPLTLIFWAWVPLLLTSSITADSFAGERERHTLETLLASRLSDRAILFGKLGAGMVYGWGIAMTSLLLGLVTVSLAHGAGRLLLYPTNVAVGGAALCFLGAGLAATAGVLISLRAATARQALQTLNLFIMALLLVPILAFQVLPAETQRQVLAWTAALDVDRALLIAVAVLAVLDGALLGAAMARFKRTRLIEA